MATQLRHLRSGDADKRPAPEEMVAGQIAINYSTGSPGLFFRNAAGAIQKVGPTHIGLTAPNSSPAGSPGVSVGESWLDTSLTPPVFKIWDGVEWVVSVGPEGPAGPQGEPGADSTVPGPEGPPGETGPSGPTAVSADAGNASKLGSDGLIYTPPFEETDLGELVVLVTQDLNLYVATTGNDVTGDGTQALPWATPHRAMAYLSKCVLGDNVVATVFVADGDYTFTQSLNLNHPQGTQIFITGSSTTGTRPTGEDLNGGGDRGNTAAARSFNEGKLNAFYNTKWTFAECNGLRCSLGGGVTVDKVLIKGDGSPGWWGVVAGNRDKGRAAGSDAAGAGFINLGGTTAVHGFGNTNVYVGASGAVLANNVTITNAASAGISVNLGGAASLQEATVSNSQSNGILVNAGGEIFAPSASSCCNGGSGFMVIYGGIIQANSCKSTNNATHGVYVAYSGTIRADRCSVTSNQQRGLYVAYSGTINATNGSVASNVGDSLRVDGDGFIRIAGTSASYDGTPSPAVNTIGNGNGYITTS